MSRNRRNSGEKRGDMGGKRNYDEDNPVPGGGGENNEGLNDSKYYKWKNQNSPFLGNRGGGNGAPVKNEGSFNRK